MPRGRRSNIKVLTGFGKRLKSISKKSDESLIKDSEQSVVEFFQSLRLLPKEHLWRIEGAAVFDEVTRNSEGVEEVNKRYWASVCNHIEAILIQTNFRGEELIQPIPRMLESGNINASATICRSLLELSSNFLDIARTIDASTDGFVRNVRDEKVDLTQTVVGSSEVVDDLLVKASFGTRYEPTLSRVSEKHKEILTQRNVLTRIDRLSKIPLASKLRPNYDFLCEFAHPNSIGYQRFWSLVEDDEPGDLVKISRRVPVQRTIETTEICLWALSWGSLAIVNSTEMCNKSIAKIRRHLVEF